MDVGFVGFVVVCGVFFQTLLLVKAFKKNNTEYLKILVYILLLFV